MPIAFARLLSARHFENRIFRPKVGNHFAKRFASSQKGIRFAVDSLVAQGAFASHHASPITTTPVPDSQTASFIPIHSFRVRTKTQFRAAVGQQLQVPYRNPQTGQVSTRYKLVWRNLPEIYKMSNVYGENDSIGQLYAGFENYETQAEQLLPFSPDMLVSFANGCNGVLGTRATVHKEEFAASMQHSQIKLNARVAKAERDAAVRQIQSEFASIGSQVKLQEIEVAVDVLSFDEVYFPAWVFEYAYLSRKMRTLVNGVTAKSIGLKVYDPMLTGLASTLLSSATVFLLLNSPIFSLLIGGVSYWLGSLAAKWVPVWRTMRMEVARASDQMQNQQYGGSSSGKYRPGQEGFDPFNGFGGFRFSGASNPFDGFPGENPFQKGSSQYQSGHGRQSQQGYSQYQQRQQNRTSASSGSSGPAGDPANLYSVLGVSKNASRDEISTAFRKLALSKHPDKINTSSQAEKDKASREFSKINEAYRVLRNEGRRSQYDKYGVVG